ncbi:MAG: TIM barrel protein [Chloroflexi bacterium]|jgi:sugar phosphate isomerase/epimerase|nr:TIM barrel protein [Chloroflexota bacterium]
MSIDPSSQFAQFLNINLPNAEPVIFSAAIAQKLRDRVDGVRLHAHTYSFIQNLTHGSFRPADVLEFAYEHELHGINIHVDDGEKHSLAQSTPKQLARFKTYTQELNLTIHLETSSTKKADIDKVVQIARTLDVQNIRVYSRYEGFLSQALTWTVADLRYMARLADQYNLFFDFEQHEEFKSTEIVHMLKRVDHPRIHALFDFTNMINACEQPLTAMKAMAPYIRQVHLKGAKVIKESKGYGQVGVVQGSPEDKMPYARMLFELLLLGEAKPQVISFALEQEVDYYAPAYRHTDEGEDPFIPYKDPSETPFDEKNADKIFLNERRWANNQVHFIKSLLATMRWQATSYLKNER